MTACPAEASRAGRGGEPSYPSCPWPRAPGQRRLRCQTSCWMASPHPCLHIFLAILPLVHLLPISQAT
eukprot:9470795-Pyramimonas_sp.AAC.1